MLWLARARLECGFDRLPGLRVTCIGPVTPVQLERGLKLASGPMLIGLLTSQTGQH